MGFDRLPDRLGSLPELYHPVQPVAPPIQNTSEMIKPLLHLAEYLSPESRARRKAIVAEAAFNYWKYAPGGPAEKEYMWLNIERARRQEEHNLSMRSKKLDIDLKEKQLKGYSGPEVSDYDSQNE